ncbi:MAG: hypothetical protein ACF8AM_07580 [Rhodopirellula sp. JB055]|uniref:hypothetical protein n=1 Tax=Rhodopirellula sp. JB055 TaxID=3342846 RepID=UPI00370A6E76
MLDRSSCRARRHTKRTFLLTDCRMLSQPLFPPGFPPAKSRWHCDNAGECLASGRSIFAWLWPAKFVRNSIGRSAKPSLLGVAFSFLQPLTAFCQPPVDAPVQAAAFTRTVITVSLDGQAADEAIDQIVAQVSSGSPNRPWTWWRDGEVDPGEIVSLNLAGGSAAQAITQLTRPLGWEAFPIPGVLLVGRPEWIDRTLGHLVGSAKKQNVDVQWPRGTTSRVALDSKMRSADAGRAFGDDEVAGDGLDWLPHDVWPAANFRRVDPWHAASLVLSEFQMAARPGTPLLRLHSQEGSLPDSVSVITEDETSWREKRFLMTYPIESSDTELRRAVRQADASASFRSGRDPKTRKKTVRVHTHPAGHRAALAAQWAAAPAPAKVAAAGRDATYDLKLLNKPAREVLQQFAGAAAKKLVVDDDADLRSQALVSLDATKQTLEQLAQSIATQANLHVDWGETIVHVSLPAE